MGAFQRQEMRVISTGEVVTKLDRFNKWEPMHTVPDMSDCYVCVVMNVDKPGVLTILEHEAIADDERVFPFRVE